MLNPLDDGSSLPLAKTCANVNGTVKFEPVVIVTVWLTWSTLYIIPPAASKFILLLFESANMFAAPINEAVAKAGTFGSPAPSPPKSLINLPGLIAVKFPLPSSSKTNTRRLVASFAAGTPE